MNRQWKISTTSLCCGNTPISANSVHAVPVGLAKAISTVAATKGGAASTNLTLIKGALKLMAWIKAKTMTIGAVVLASLIAAPIAVRNHYQIRLPDHLSKDSLARDGNVGHETPEAALRTLLWAMTQANYPAVMSSATPEQQAKMENELKDEPSREAFVARMKRNAAPVSGFTITGYNRISPDTIVVEVRTEGVDKSDEWTFRKIGNEWKFGE